LRNLSTLGTSSLRPWNFFFSFNWKLN